MHIGTVSTEPEERPSKHFIARLLVIFEEVLIKFSILDNNREGGGGGGGGVQYSLVKLTFLIPNTKKRDTLFTGIRYSL